MDVEKSGTYLTALNIYGKMFQDRPAIVQPFINPTALGDDEGTRRRRSALMSLSDPTFYTAYPKIDVVVLVGGQPLGLLEKNIPSNLKLLKFDASNSDAAKVMQEYHAADIGKASYPALHIEGNGLTSLAVDSYLVTANFADPQRNVFIQEFAASFCTNFDVLKERGHAKWKALNWQPGLALPTLAAGWKYSDHVKSRLVACKAKPVTASLPTKADCSPQDQFSKLCNKK